MAGNTSKCNHLPPLPYKGLTSACVSMSVAYSTSRCKKWKSRLLHRVEAAISFCAVTSIQGIASLECIVLADWCGMRSDIKVQLREVGETQAVIGCESVSTSAAHACQEIALSTPVDDILVIFDPWQLPLPASRLRPEYFIAPSKQRQFDHSGHRVSRM